MPSIRLNTYYPFARCSFHCFHQVLDKYLARLFLAKFEIVGDVHNSEKLVAMDFKCCLLVPQAREVLCGIAVSNLIGGFAQLYSNCKLILHSPL